MPVLKGQGPLSKGVSGAIGLATEAYAHHQESKEKQIPADSTPNDHSEPNIPLPRTAHSGIDHGHHASPDDSSDDEDEEDWIRDEMETQLEPRRADGSYEGNPSIDSIVESFARQHPPPPYSATTGRLPCAVIIPQRRPETNRRGFVAAYAPVLNDIGISERTFMDFHQSFQQATHKQGWFNAVNLAVALSVLAETAAVAPSVIVHAVAFCVHASIEAGRRLYITHETNKVLDSMNEKLFKPHGLYAMIMAYKPNSSQMSETIDINANITNAVGARVSGNRSTYRASSGKTHGAAQLPEAAPLVFPLLRDASDTDKKNAFKRAADFHSDYTDRRAQATFEAHNPDAGQLTSGEPPRKAFASRWADPNHPVNQGGLLNVLSGGAINPRNRLEQKRQYKTARTGRESASSKLQQRKEGSMVGKAKRAVHENVLYLMIVNMPSEEEMRAAADVMAKAKSGGLGQQLQAMMGT